MKKAFTLIELLMVIAIIGIISALAVSKVGGVRESSARKVSLASQIAVERAVSSFLAGGGRLSRLDSLVCTQGRDTRREWTHGGRELPATGGFGFDCTYTNFTARSGRDELYLGPNELAGGVGSEDALQAFRDDCNAGVTPGLMAVLCPFELKPGYAEALCTRLGLRHVMAHNVFPCDPSSSDAYSDARCADGTYVESNGDGGRNPNESACVAIAVTNRMAVFAVNPVVERGRAIYRACGQDLMRSERAGQRYDENAAVAEVYATGGPLLAFGLSDRATIVGKADAGLESAPTATYPARNFYARYVLLFRMRTAGTAIIPEFAGVIDPCGNTVRAAREVIRNL